MSVKQSKQIDQNSGKESATADLREALRELNEKILALPASLEQGFQRAFERALKEYGGLFNNVGDGPSGQQEKQATKLDSTTPKTAAKGNDSIFLKNSIG